MTVEVQNIHIQTFWATDCMYYATNVTDFGMLGVTLTFSHHLEVSTRWLTGMYGKAMELIHVDEVMSVTRKTKENLDVGIGDAPIYVSHSGRRRYTVCRRYTPSNGARNK